jgi:hypothetical protein
MRSHILKKAVVLDTPQVKAASVDKAGTPVSFREIIRAKASNEGGSLTPSKNFIVLYHIVLPRSPQTQDAKQRGA